MIDSVGLYSGIKPRPGASEITYFSMATSSSAIESHQNNNIRDPAPGIFEPHPKLPSGSLQIGQATGFPNPLRQGLPCKGEPEAVRYGRFEREKNGYMYPQTGYARSQKRGLAFDFDKPMNLPIMPIAGFYNQDMLNVLGGLPA